MINKSSYDISNHSNSLERLLLHIIFFLVWPFGALFASLRNLRSRQTKYLFFIFCVYCGFVFVLPINLIGKWDSEHYALRFLQYRSDNVSFGEILNDVYTDNNGYVDIIEPLLTRVIAIISDNTTVLFVVYSFVFGAFYTQNIWFILERGPEIIKKQIILLLIIALLFFINPIWNINGFRYYLAAHIFVFGMYKYFFCKDSRFWIWLIISGLVHFSFLFMLPVVIVYFQINKYIFILLLFYYLAFLYGLVGDMLLLNISDNLPDILSSKINRYTDVGYVEYLESVQYSLHIVLAKWSSKIIGLIWITLLYLYRGKWLLNKIYYRNYFSFLLLFGGIVQILSIYPSGVRFFSVFNFLLIGLIYLIYSNENTKKISQMSYLSFPFMLLYFIGLFRFSINFIGFNVIIGNIFTALIYKENISIAGYLF